MGFPRILSKNNKIYTKLGEFCLSGDGSLWIICHTCQLEVQHQDHFWKHIQDEHNFAADHRNANTFVDNETAPLLPLPLYRKVNDEEQRGAVHDDDSQEQNEPKDYTEMRAIESNAVEIDIKVEPTPINQAIAAHAQHVQVGAGGTTTLYQIPQLPPPASVYSNIPPMSMVMAPHILPTQHQPHQQVQHHGHDLPKDQITAHANASSAVSSEDGERWYICDYETCGLKFKYQSRLELHRSVHSKERRFACEVCGASFKQSCNLSTHRKKKHALKGTKMPMIIKQQF